MFTLFLRCRVSCVVCCVPTLIRLFSVGPACFERILQMAGGVAEFGNVRVIQNIISPY